jgi:hypothetical protein
MCEPLPPSETPLEGSFFPVPPAITVPTSRRSVASHERGGARRAEGLGSLEKELAAL